MTCYSATNFALFALVRLIGRVNKVIAHRARPVLGWVSGRRYTILIFTESLRPDRQSTVTPLWIGAVNEVLMVTTGQETTSSVPPCCRILLSVNFVVIIYATVLMQNLFKRCSL